MLKLRLGQTPQGEAVLIYDPDLEEWALYVGGQATRRAIVGRRDRWWVLPSEWGDRAFATHRDAANELLERLLAEQHAAQMAARQPC